MHALILRFASLQINLRMLQMFRVIPISFLLSVYHNLFKHRPIDPIPTNNGGIRQQHHAANPPPPPPPLRPRRVIDPAAANRTRGSPDPAAAAPRRGCSRPSRGAIVKVGSCCCWLPWRRTADDPCCGGAAIDAEARQRRSRRGGGGGGGGGSVAGSLGAAVGFFRWVGVGAGDGDLVAVEEDPVVRRAVLPPGSWHQTTVSSLIHRSYVLSRRGSKTNGNRALD